MTDTRESTDSPKADPLGALRCVRVVVEKAGDLVAYAISDARAAGLTDFENDFRNAADGLAGIITEIDDAIVTAEARSRG